MPIENGSPITGYLIYVQATNDGDFIQESFECNGATAAIIDARRCSVQLSTLTAAPYNLVLDEEVKVKVIS
jgi:hypothetical protein